MSKSRFLISLCLTFALTCLAAGADLPGSCNCEKGYYEKVVTAYKKVCREEHCPTVVRKPYLRHEMRPFKTTVMVPREVLVKQPRQIQVPEERIVTKCRKVPVKMMDPHTGCCIIIHKDEYYPVKVTVLKTQTVMVDCMVRTEVPQEQIIMKSCPVWDWRDETVIVTRQHCMMVPYQAIIRVPCPPPGPNYSVPVPLEPHRPLGVLSSNVK